VLTVAYIEKSVHFSSLGLFETTNEEKDWISLAGLLLVCVYLSHSSYESYLVWVTLRLPRFLQGHPTVHTSWTHNIAAMCVLWTYLPSVKKCIYFCFQFHRPNFSYSKTEKGRTNGSNIKLVNYLKVIAGHPHSSIPHLSPVPDQKCTKKKLLAKT
jgi:hypothetical protein